jgi:hypothetical protein
MVNTTTTASSSSSSSSSSNSSSSSSSSSSAVGKAWTNEVVDNQRMCRAPVGCNDEECYNNAKTCSYADQKRGMKGYDTSAPITLKFTDMVRV